MAVFVEKQRGWPLDNAVEEPPAPEPVEDSGAETYSRYRWQARAAVIDALRMVARDVEDERAGREPPERRIVCERFEDWVVFDGGNREFVSAKHRELRRGPWTFSTVVDDGGLGHLFRTWNEFGSAVRCRLVSNMALQSGKGDVLPEVCRRLGSSIPDSGDGEKISHAVRSVAQQLMALKPETTGLPESERTPAPGKRKPREPSPWLLERTRTFLGCLSFDLEVLDRQRIASLGAHAYVKPMLKQLGLPEADPEAIWTAVFGLVDPCMEAAAETAWGELEPVRPVFSADPLSDEKRTVTSRQVRQAIVTAASRPRGYRPVPRLVPRTVAGVKMLWGGCGRTAIAQAERHMAAWRRVRDNDVPHLAEEIEEYQDDLADLFARLESRTRAHTVPGVQYGAALWSELLETPDDQLPAPPVALKRKHVTGAVADLADRCLLDFGGDDDVDPKAELHSASGENIRRLAGGAR